MREITKADRGRRWIAGGIIALAIGFSAGVYGQKTSGVAVGVKVPSVVQRSVNMGHKSPTDKLYVNLALKLANPAGLQAFADAVSDPKSPMYRQYLTPKEIGAKFGLPDASVQQVVTYLKSKGLNVTLVADNHMNIMVEGTVAQVESTFGTTINKYHAYDSNEPGRIDYYSYSTPPTMPTNIASFVGGISGIENFTKPRPRILTATQTRSLYNTAPLYAAKMQGQGRNLAISSWDGFRLTNVPLYYTQYGLPVPAAGVGTNVTVVTVSGGSGAGSAQGEADLDIQMVLGMAPLCNFTIYDGGGDLVSVLTLEANDNKADVISESYGWNLQSTDATSAHNLHLSMTAQGITYMAATGDFGTTLEPFSYPNYEPEVLQVGGTIATADGAGKRATEVGWSGSGGGWSTNGASFNKLPSFQKGKGVPTNINFRLNPDISLNADGGNSGAYYFYYNGSLNGDFSGTSFASPVFCGQLGVAEQKLISMGGLPTDKNGKQRIGRFQDIVYSQNGRSDVWFDVTSGSNGVLPNGQTSTAGAGWDFVTGFGAMDVNAFIGTVQFVPPTVLNPTAVAFYSGKSATGALSDITSTDGLYYQVSTIGSNVGQTAGATTTFTLTGDTTKVSSLKVAVTGNTSVAATHYLYIYNVAKGTYDLLQASAWNATDKTVTATITSPAAYISSSKKVVILDRSVLPDRIGSVSYRLRLNQLTLTETF